MKRYQDRPYFFESGICFACTGCGRCCCGSPGLIRVTKEDIVLISNYLNETPDNIMREWIKPYQNNYTIRERSDGCCAFYASGCRIYPVRPPQCRLYPFWFTTLRSEEKWAETVKACPGIGKGDLYTKEQILEMVSKSYQIVTRQPAFF